MALNRPYLHSRQSVLSGFGCLCRNLYRSHARPLSRTKNVRVSDGDPRRNQSHPHEDDKPPGRRLLWSSSHLSILPSEHPTPPGPRSLSQDFLCITASRGAVHKKLDVRRGLYVSLHIYSAPQDVDPWYAVWWLVGA